MPIPARLRSLLRLIATMTLAYLLGLYGPDCLRQLHAWWTPAPDYAAISDHAGGALVLVSTSSCPWCAKTRDWLAAQRLSYQDCVIDESNALEPLLTQLGERAVPQLLTRDGRVIGYDPAAFQQLVTTLPTAIRPRSEPARWPCVSRLATPG